MQNSGLVQSAFVPHGLPDAPKPGLTHAAGVTVPQPGATPICGVPVVNCSWVKLQHPVQPPPIVVVVVPAVVVVVVAGAVVLVVPAADVVVVAPVVVDVVPPAVVEVVAPTPDHFASAALSRSCIRPAT